jgi:PAS domain S-box-containing protein
MSSITIKATDPAYILENLPFAVVKMDKNYRVVYANSSAVGIFGKSHSDILGSVFFELIPEFEKVKIEFFYRNISFIPASHSSSHSLDDFSCLITHKIFSDAEGITVFLEKEDLSTTFSSERKELQLRELFNELPGGVLVLDSQSNRVAYSNKIIQEWMALSGEEMENQTLTSIFSKDDQELISNAFSKNSSSKKQRVTGVNLLTPRKEKIPVELTIVQLDWNSRTCHCVFFTDVRQKEDSVRSHSEWEKYRELLGKLAVKFIHIPNANLANALEEALGIAGRLSNSQRAFVLRFDMETDLAHTDYTWVESGIPTYREKLSVLPLGLLSPAREALISDKMLHYQNIELLPDSDPVKGILMLLKIKTLLLLPIMEGDELYGVVGFGKVSSSLPFSDSELLPIQLVLEIISNSLLREKMDYLLKEREKENQKLFTNSPLGLIFQDNEGNIIRANPAALSLLDLSLNDIAGWDVFKPDWKAFSEEGRQLFTFNLAARECIKTGLPQKNSILSVYRPSQKDTVWLSMDAVPEYNSDSEKPIRVFTTIKDITEQRNYFSGVVLAENRYRTLIDNLPGPVYSYRKDRLFIPNHISGKIYELSGYNADDFLIAGVKISDLIHPGDFERVQKDINQAVLEKKPFQLSYRLITRSGQERWIEDRGELVMLENSESFIIGFMNDISDRVEVKLELENNKKLLEAIVENSHSAIFVKDLDSNFIMVNRRWEIITGHSRDKIIGKKLVDILGKELSAKYDEDDQKVLKEGKITFTEEKLEHYETNSSVGTSQYFLSIKFPYRNGTGQIIGMCGISTDISAVKEASMMVEEREANLHGILESVNESIWSLDKNLNILFTNQTFFNEYFQAYGVELVKGINIITSLPDPIERKKWSKRYREVLDSGRTLHFLDKISSPLKTHHLEVIIYPIKVHGEVEGISVFSKDISEKMALEESSKLYLNLFESATNEIHLISAKTLVIKQSNLAAQNNTGYSLKEFLGLSFLNLISSKDQDLLLERMSSISLKKITSSFLEVTCLRKDGSFYPAELLLQLFNFEGEDYLSVFITDISERKRTQLALQESELRFSQIFKGNVTPMLLVDPYTGRIEDANPSAANYYGFSLEKLKSLHILDVNQTFIEDPQEMVSVTKEVLETGKGKFLFKHKLNSGELRSVEVFCSKISIDNRELVHEIVQDVTDRNNFYNALVNQNEALREIAWIQSHVVRAPLAKIMGLVQLLQTEKGNEGNSPFEFLLDAILNAANELDKVVFDISEKSNNAKHLLD